MKISKQRKQAAIISLTAAAGNLAVIIGITVSAYSLGSIGEIVRMITSIPQCIFMFFAGLMTLIVGIVLLTSIQLSKRILFALFLLTIVTFTIAAFQKSIVVLFLLFWPWSIYKLYQSDPALTEKCT